MQQCCSLFTECERKTGQVTISSSVMRRTRPTSTAQLLVSEASCTPFPQQASNIVNAKDILHACRTVVGQTACTTFQCACNSPPEMPSAWCLETMGVLYSARQPVPAVHLSQQFVLVAAHHPTLHSLAGLRGICLCQLARQAPRALPASKQMLYQRTKTKK